MLILVALILALNSSCQNIENNEFEKHAIKIVKAFHNQDSQSINQMIHDDLGLIVLYRRGVFDEFEKVEKIDFMNPVPEYLPYFDFQIDTTITYQSLPTYDCDKGKWSKFGLYCDLTIRDSLVSTTAINLIKYRKDKISKETIAKFKEIESSSHRIVLIDNEDGVLIFYLTLIDNKWYLTVLDRVTGDCSA